MELNEINQNFDEDMLVVGEEFEFDYIYLNINNHTQMISLGISLIMTEIIFN